MKKHFTTIAKIALVLIYLVIIAGAVVRMTGSGMGCPDWPKCFGYYVPPTQIEDIQFKPGHDYKKGVVIIKDEALLVAERDFISSENIDLSNWKPYTKHNYSKFNATHTWVEYINRLLGALSGIPILIFTVLSFWFWKKNKWITIISLLTLVGMGFQAWLGKTVVDSNLAPFKITVHMVMAMVIVAFILYLIFISKSDKKTFKADSLFSKLLMVGIILTLIQIILGTQVREYVDEQMKLQGNLDMDAMSTLPVSFYVHRSFSIIVLLLNVWLFWRNRKAALGHYKINIMLACIGLEIVTGIAMYYFEFPFLSQPIHLVIATLIFGIQFYILLESYTAKRSLKASNSISL